MDFITQLPPSKGYDAITVFVDRLTKMTHILPSKTTDTSQDIQRLLDRWVIRLHGCPMSIISDRDPRLTSNHWQKLCKDYGIKQCLSTSYHPQTDGQTERMNRTIEQILRMFINYNQNNWADLLPTTEFSINNSSSATTKFTPFYLNYGYNPRIPGTLTIPSQDAPLITMNAQIEQVKKIIETAQETQASYYDQRRTEDTFNVGDMVLLKTSHLKIPISNQQKSTKLTNNYIGPYKIIEQVGNNAFKLKLPPHLNKLHPVFSIVFLKHYHNPQLNFPNREHYDFPEPEYIDGSLELEVEKILDDKIKTNKNKKTHFYLIKWKGRPESEATWQKREDLTNCGEILQQYEFLKGGGNVKKIRLRLHNDITMT